MEDLIPISFLEENVIFEDDFIPMCGREDDLINQEDWGLDLGLTL